MFDSTKRNPENSTLPFSHWAKDFHFQCSRCDFFDYVIVTGNFENIEEKKNLIAYTLAVSEMIAWHALMIHPYLASFQGYDCVRYKLFQGE